MKANIKSKNKPREFEPLYIELTIETPEEAYELWHRLNFNISEVKEMAARLEVYECPLDDIEYDESFYQLWHTIDANLISQGLKEE